MPTPMTSNWESAYQAIVAIDQACLGDGRVRLLRLAMRNRYGILRPESSRRAMSNP
jgi:hypothetical protein